MAENAITKKTKIAIIGISHHTSPVRKRFFKDAVSKNFPDLKKNVRVEYLTLNEIHIDNTLSSKDNMQIFLEERQEEKLCIVCDANLQNINGYDISDLVIYLSLHPKIYCLSLYSNTPECNAITTPWARINLGYLSDESVTPSIHDAVKVIKRISANDLIKRCRYEEIQTEKIEGIIDEPAIESIYESDLKPTLETLSPLKATNLLVSRNDDVLDRLRNSIDTQSVLDRSIPVPGIRFFSSKQAENRRLSSIVIENLVSQFHTPKVMARPETKQLVDSEKSMPLLNI